MFYLKKFSVVAALVTSVMLVGPVSAGDKGYFKSIQGKWSGPGNIVAGKFKGTKFTCKFDGTNRKSVTGMKIEGSCRVGIFSQPMNIEINKVGRSFRGKFLDGAKGKGLDIVSGRLRGSRLVVGINRNKLRGTMVANMRGNNRLNITISVKVAKRQIPVIGLTLERRASVIKTSVEVD